MTRPVRMSAGAVVWRSAPGGDARDLEVLLVHRPRHGDWSVPKGTVERGELRPVTAVREVEEETGIRARLGVPLVTLEYEYARGRMKNVAYWSARAVSGDVDVYVPNHEIDGVAWVRLRKARRRVSYDNDRTVLDAFADQVAGGHHTARALLVVRHAKARSRDAWRKDPLERPLSAEGKRQAERLRAVLAAYGVRHVATSGAVRCAQTVEPYAQEHGRTISVDHRLDEPRDGGSDKQRPVTEAMLGAADHKQPVAVCGHRTMIPQMLRPFGIDAAEADADPLPPAGLVVVHHRHGETCAFERHDPR